MCAGRSKWFGVRKFAAGVVQYETREWGERNSKVRKMRRGEINWSREEGRVKKHQRGVHVFGVFSRKSGAGREIFGKGTVCATTAHTHTSRIPNASETRPVPPRTPSPDPASPRLLRRSSAHATPSSPSQSRRGEHFPPPRPAMHAKAHFLQCLHFGQALRQRAHVAPVRLALGAEIGLGAHVLQVAELVVGLQQQQASGRLVVEGKDVLGQKDARDFVLEGLADKGEGGEDLWADDDTDAWNDWVTGGVVSMWYGWVVFGASMVVVYFSGREELRVDFEADFLGDGDESQRAAGKGSRGHGGDHSGGAGRLLVGMRNDGIRDDEVLVGRNRGISDGEIFVY